MRWKCEQSGKKWGSCFQCCDSQGWGFFPSRGRAGPRLGSGWVTLASRLKKTQEARRHLLRPTTIGEAAHMAMVVGRNQLASLADLELRACEAVR
jgi:hypothetical protein